MRSGWYQRAPGYWEYWHRGKRMVRNIRGKIYRDVEQPIDKHGRINRSTRYAPQHHWR